MILVGVDGCPGGWLSIVSREGRISAFIARTMDEVLEYAKRVSIVAVDVPMGLPDRGARGCDLEARLILRRPRSASVFPAPVRKSLSGRDYEDASKKHREADGRGMSRQVHNILHKIREVDNLLVSSPRLRKTIREVHPEVSFALWNKGRAMTHRKARREGRVEREVLIDQRWPLQRAECVSQLSGRGTYRLDDLNDAFAALWTAERISRGKARVLSSEPGTDRRGLRMEIWA